MFGMRSASTLVALAAALAAAAASSNSRASFLVRHAQLPFSDKSDAQKVGDSYAGHIVVRKTPQYEAGLFYWFLKAEQHAASAPLVVWIQGGPGGSSIEDGLFFEMGPLRVFQENGTDWKVRRNPYSWTTKYNMIFLENPVGTGFSYVDPPAESVMSEDMHRFWTQHLLESRTHVNEATTKVVSNADFANYTNSRSQFQFVNQNDGTTSSVDDDDKDFVNGYAANEAGVSKDFITFMNGFYDIFPETRKLSLHLTSESYGGKYVPEIAAAIATYNDDDKTDDARKIPLTTLAIGNQWTDPASQIVTHPDHFLQLGLIDDLQAKQLLEPINAAVDAIHRSDWQAGLRAREEMFGMLKVFTGGINWYDFRLGDKSLSLWTDPIVEWLRLNETQKLLHAERKVFGTDGAVYDSLTSDIMKSTLSLFPGLLERYKILIYQGHADLRDGVVSNTRWIERIDWEGRIAFKYSPRKVWRSSAGDLQGYSQQHANLTRVVLLGCGHLAPADAGCPAASLDMIARHIDNKEFV